MKKKEFTGCFTGCLLQGCFRLVFLPVLFFIVVAIYVCIFVPDGDDEPASDGYYPTEFVASSDSTSQALPVLFDGEIPQKPYPERCVNDFADVLNADPVFEDSLEALSAKTGTQIVVVTVHSLGDHTANEFATAIGNQWGVGQKGKDNGLVILIKEKNNTKGEIYLATGRGMEAVLPDATCKHIVEDEMISVLKGDGSAYDEALWAGLKVIMPICRGEYTADRYEAYSDKTDIHVWMIGLLLILTIIGGRWLFNKIIGGGVTLLGIDDSYLGGTFGDFTGGGFSFGGGSFGGGGAGGSW